MRKLIITAATLAFAASVHAGNAFYDPHSQHGDHLGGIKGGSQTAYQSVDRPNAFWDSSVNYGDHGLANDTRSTSPGSVGIGDSSPSLWDQSDFFTF